MQLRYIKFTYVLDPVSKGFVYPSIPSLEFVWARESQYPTDAPELFGTVHEDADINVEGVLGEFNEDDFNLMHQDELLAREKIMSNQSKITKLAFRNRFSQQEKVLIEMAALDDPSKTLQERQQAATLRAYLKDTEVATFIQLTKPDTVTGVTMIETLGLLAEGRASEILNNPIEPHEKYIG